MSDIWCWESLGVRVTSPWLMVKKRACESATPAPKRAFPPLVRSMTSGSSLSTAAKKNRKIKSSVYHKTKTFFHRLEVAIIADWL